MTSDVIRFTVLCEDGEFTESRRSPKLVSILLLALLLIAPHALDAQERDSDPALPTIDEVRSRVDETLGSILTLRVTYRRSQSPDADSPIDLTGSETIDWQEYIWNWSMNGDKRAMEREPKRYAESGAWGHIHEAFDGRKTYSAVYSRDDPHIMTALSVNSPAGTAEFYNFYPDSWIGLKLNRTDETLQSLLARPEANVLGWESVEGHECLHIDLGECKNRTGKEISFEVWLDPVRDWLPRQIVSHRTVQRSGAASTELVTRQITADFQRVFDTVLGRERWFPRVCALYEMARVDHEVMKVSINDLVPSTVFVIDPQNGTEITEWFPNDPDEPVRRWVHGGSDGLSILRQRTVAQARQMSPPLSTQPVDASPEPGVGIAKFGWLLAILLAGAALVVWRRQQ